MRKKKYQIFEKRLRGIEDHQSNMSNDLINRIYRKNRVIGRHKIIKGIIQENFLEQKHPCVQSKRIHWLLSTINKWRQTQAHRLEVFQNSLGPIHRQIARGFLMDKKRNLNNINLDDVKVKLDWERDSERDWEEREVEDSVGRLESLLYKLRMKSYCYGITKEGSECCLKLQGWPMEKLWIMF